MSPLLALKGGVKPSFARLLALLLLLSSLTAILASGAFDGFKLFEALREAEEQATASSSSFQAHADWGEPTRNRGVATPPSSSSEQGTSNPNVPSWLDSTHHYLFGSDGNGAQPSSFEAWAKTWLANHLSGENLTRLLHGGSWGYLESEKIRLVNALKEGRKDPGNIYTMLKEVPDYVNNVKSSELPRFLNVLLDKVKTTRTELATNKARGEAYVKAVQDLWNFHSQEYEKGSAMKALAAIAAEQRILMPWEFGGTMYDRLCWIRDSWNEKIKNELDQYERLAESPEGPKVHDVNVAQRDQEVDAMSKYILWLEEARKRVALRAQQQRRASK